jgi:hypothetical protein
VQAVLGNFLFPLDVFTQFAIMRATIDLDHQKQAGAEEIHDIVRNWFLTMKIVSKHSFPPQLLPQHDFCNSHVLPQHSGDRFQSGIIWQMLLLHASRLR